MSAALVRSDATAIPLGDNTVDLVVTSPPYFALRSYQDGGEHYGGQIGSEATPTAFLEALWAVTAECWRVLKPSGSLFVNLGDKYATSGTRQGNADGLTPSADYIDARKRYSGRPAGFREKSLMGLPWRYAIGCIDGQADPDGRGWVLRSEIVWSKPNGLPESVTDRVRRSHEQWFHLTKEGRYYSNVDEVREPSNESERPQARRAAELAAAAGLTEAHREALLARGLGDGKKSAVTKGGTGKNTAEVLRLAEEAEAALGSYAREFTMSVDRLGKLPGSVWNPPEDEPWLPPDVAATLTNPDDSATAWTIPTQPLIVPDWLNVDHFAAFPTEWPRRIILGWSPPDGIVLDPFGGTGTTCLVARALGRYGVSCDLSGDYQRLAKWRIWQSGQAARVAAKTDGERQGDLFGAIA